MIVFAGHGSRVGGANIEFETLVDSYQKSHPEEDISFGYIEFAEPLLLDAVRDAAKKSKEVVVVPIILFAAGHMKRDLPNTVETVKSEFPECSIKIARELGVHPDMAGLVYERTKNFISDDEKTKKETIGIMVGRGSSDPDARADFLKMTKLLSLKSGIDRVLPCFVGIAFPRLNETLEVAANMRPHAIVVVPYFLFDGVLLNKIREQVEDFSARHFEIDVKVASHLGVHEKLLSVMRERIEEVDVI